MKGVIARLKRYAPRVGLRPTSGGRLRPPKPLFDQRSKTARGRSGATRFAGEPAKITAGLALALSLAVIGATPVVAAGSQSDDPNACAKYGENGSLCYLDAGLEAHETEPLVFVDKRIDAVVTLHLFERSPCNSISKRFPKGVEASLFANVHEEDRDFWAFTSEIEADDRRVRWSGDLTGHPEDTMVLVGVNECNGENEDSMEAYFLVLSRTSNVDLAPLVSRVEGALNWPNLRGAAQ